MTYALRVSLVNETEGHMFSEWTEDLDNFYNDDVLTDEGEPNYGAIYREVRAEYGRCTGSVYVDTADGAVKRCGWYFVSRQRYEDTNEPYLRGAWVTVVDRIPERLVHVDMGLR